MALCLSVCLTAFLLTCLLLSERGYDVFVCLPACLSASLYVCLSVCLAVCLSASLYVCPSTRLSIRFIQEGLN